MTLVPQSTVPPLDPIQLVLDSVTSPLTKAAYRTALTDFLGWWNEQGRPPLSKAVVQRYVAVLVGDGRSSASVNQRLSAIRKLVREAADNGQLGIFEAESIARVKGIKKQGQRTGAWLSRVQAQELLLAPDVSTLRGLRDRALLAVLLGCGLRRSELVNLTFQHVQQREGRWVVLDLTGKHGRTRTVPMPAWCKAAMDAWTTKAELNSGHIFRPTAPRGSKVLARACLSHEAVALIVRKYGTQVGRSDLTPEGVALAPHDLRRTFAKLAHKGGAPIDQIQLSLGHASIQTTEVYLGIDQNLESAPCDVLGLSLKGS
ncbi:tyrosine-type recombinase/integrase [Deinococcus sp. QL22]|uniref:tyrosine-type recombinase/integrase n=1 Tax=Deinococcus sp. QL22 TaxID=2939437 RepID=UPI0020175B34|nr:tyrosine-type recombinase/integrase [Deinococcus sp. QL22]UQN10684.1 tyrosine-type recombinase/integrase [Deinococcus sp. QL22]